MKEKIDELEHKLVEKFNQGKKQILDQLGNKIDNLTLDQSHS